ncbi:MAG: hypothetical protein ACI3XZ_03950 [Butyricicoccus sp.]
MYNRYLTAAQQQRPPEPPPRVEREPAAGCGYEPHEQVSPVGGLLGSLSQRLADFRLDADTLVVLAVVWFVLGDQDGEMDTELLALLVVLLLLGI